MPRKKVVPALPAPTPAPARLDSAPTAALWTLEETSRFLGLPPWTIRELYWSHELPGRIIRRKLRFSRIAVENFINGVTQGAA